MHLAALVGLLAIACSGGDPAPAAGSLDASFGQQGLVLADTGVVTRATVTVHAATDDRGRLWLSGSTTEPGNAIRLRLLPDGTQDRAFGSDGKIISPAFANDDALFAVYARATIPASGGGATLVDGASTASCFSGPSCGVAGGFRVVTHARIGRIDDSGAALASFGVDGVALVEAESFIDFAPGPGGGAVLVIAPRRDLFAASTPSNRVVRVDASGRRDAAFEANAAAALDCPGVPPGAAALLRVAVLADGRTLVVQSFVARAPGEPRLCVARLGPEGRPDPAFGTEGRVVLDDPSVPAGAVLNLLGLFANPEGSAEIAISFLPGSIDPSRPPFRLVAVTAAGRPDAARFGLGAFAGASPPIGLANAIARDAEGRYLVGGFPISQPFAIQIERPRLARFRADGSLDESFGASGPGFTALRFDASGARLAPAHIHVARGAVVVAGIAVFDDPRVTSRMAAARLSVP